MTLQAAPTPSPEPEGGIFNVVLGTAGHIDHGKSALVEALTGIHPDRLKEEQDRGITIDIGFAPLELSNGLRVNIIDVPGHERFIKNMVAGASGIDFVILVVAADDGVMAQTREHLQIIQLLGVPDGLTVINKMDLVEPGFADLVEEDLRKVTVGTCLEGKPVLRVSAKTRAGVPELRAALNQALTGLTRRTSRGPFRLPVQRVFAKEGFGTVLTGVTVSGSLGLGETLAILPPGFTGRVKGLQAYGRKITRAHAGHSTAINVTGIERETVTRGMQAVTPDVFRATTLAAAHLLHLSDAPYPLKHRAPVRFHSGTAEIMGKVLLLDHEQLPPGQEAYVQIVLEEPALLVPGDRYILRHQSPVVTLGGGQILDNRALKRKRFSPELAAELAARRERLGHPREFLALLLERAGEPRAVRDLCAEAGQLSAEVLADLGALEKDRRVVTLKAGELYAGAPVFETLRARVVAEMEAFFKEHPALGGIARPDLRARIEKARRAEGLDEAPWFDELLAALERHQAVTCAGNEVRLAGRERKLDARWAAHAQKIEDALRAGGLTPPPATELGTLAQLQPKALKEVLRYLLETGRAVEATPEIYFHREVYGAAFEKVKALFARMPELTVSEIRQELGLNRKFVVPLLETFDREGLTKRVGDKRQLVKR
jgi:selenocysteine-specific elongation factor